MPALLMCCYWQKKIQEKDLLWKKNCLKFKFYIEHIKGKGKIENLRETVALVAFQASYFIGQITKTIDQK